MIMMASAKFTSLALNDLKEIHDFIAKDKSRIASQ
jgi:plasmid stabilization system protein ParE